LLITAGDSVSQTSSNSWPQCFAFDPCDGTDSGGKRGVFWADGAEKDGNGWRLAICRSQIVLSILPGMVYRSIASPAARNALTNRSGSTSDFRYGTCRGLQAGKPHNKSFKVIDPHHRMYPSFNLTSYRDLFQKAKQHGSWPNWDREHCIVFAEPGDWGQWVFGPPQPSRERRSPVPQN
jgi:hypothetical protein